MTGTLPPGPPLRTCGQKGRFVGSATCPGAQGKGSVLPSGGCWEVGVSGWRQPTTAPPHPASADTTSPANCCSPRSCFQSAVTPPPAATAPEPPGRLCPTTQCEGPVCRCQPPTHPSLPTVHAREAAAPRQGQAGEAPNRPWRSLVEDTHGPCGGGRHGRRKGLWANAGGCRTRGKPGGL